MDKTMTSWERYFKAGVAHYKGGRYEKALNAFNQAIRENSLDKALFDSRAAVLENLGRAFDALKDCKKVIELEPDAWQGYARSARLFLRIRKPERTLKMAELALERVKDTDGMRRADLEALREQAVLALELRPCHFSKIPVELETEIFEFAIDGSNTKMLALTLVCRQWRNIILDNPKFWRHLVLKRKRTLKKADVWLDRARGVLSSLRIGAGFSFAKRPGTFKNASKDIWLKLDALEVMIGEDGVDSVLPPGSFQQLRLRSLTFELAKPSPDFLKSLCNMEASRMRSLDVTTPAQWPIEPENLPFTSLTSLRVAGNFSRYGLLSLLHRNLSLEILSIRVGCGLPATEIIHRVELPYLRQLELEDLSTFPWLRTMRVPKLEVVRLKQGLCDSCIEDLLNQGVAHLEEFGFYLGGLGSPGALVDLFWSARSLRRLELPGCVFLSGIVNSVVDSLSLSSLLDIDDGTGRTIPCPRLQHVDLSRHDLVAGPVVRLVKSRLPNTTTALDKESDAVPSSGDSVGRVLPIISLKIDECDLIDADALSWLRATVPFVSYKMKPIKMRRGRGRR